MTGKDKRIVAEVRRKLGEKNLLIGHIKDEDVLIIINVANEVKKELA